MSSANVFCDIFLPETHGGQICDSETASFVFSEQASEDDTERLFFAVDRHPKITVRRSLLCSFIIAVALT